MANPYETDNEIEIDLKDLVFELLSHWKSIVLVTILAGAIGFFVSEFLMTPKYESTSELYVLSKSTSITSLADIQMGTSLTNDYMVVVKGRPVLEQVIANLGLEETYASLYNRVSLNNPTNSRILEITVTDTNPQRAKAIADEIAKVGSAFIAEKMDQDPPTIIQSGYADGLPVSPNVIKNAFLGAVVGAFLVVALILVTYIFNDTITTPEDIERKLGMNILGTLPLEEAEDDGERRTSKGKRKPVKKGKK
ncbi:MAG: Wzz/FepE/Etk N-terminal domain-containing protein [Lachnospiraceae bacterium]|nr:Wzz/FepE/Etk N-terminal domain-containing protein [Lachnospiraceae bacterium]MDD6505324.1 Wzz/FepE/Etk N-terminal domain-containing protein [Lachnospiraceae bacterium]